MEEKPRLQNREEVERILQALPRRLTLSTQVTECTDSYHTPGAPTLEDELTKVGAFPKDGKLYDATGKEIRIVQRDLWGTPSPERVLEQERKEFEDLQKRYRVIVLSTIHP
jgi:hypothetical protein